MADRIVELLDDDGLRSNLVANGLDYVRRYDWDDSSRRLAEFLREYGATFES